MNLVQRAFDNQNQWWKYLLVIIGSFIISNIVGAIPLLGVIIFKSLQGGGAIMPNPDNPADLSVYGINSTWGLALMIFPFVVALLTVILLIKPLHKRKLTEIINGTFNIRWNRFFFSALVWFILMGIYLVFCYFSNPENYQLRFNIDSFLPLLLVSILLIPFQTSYEEVIFRGYLTQGFSVWTRNRILTILFPAVFFALMHSFNPEVKEFGFLATMPGYFTFGLVFGVVSMLDNGIETAMGAHAANNIFASVMITHKSSVLQTDALFEQFDINITQENISLLISGLVFIGILALKYKWNFSVLGKAIVPPQQQ